MLDTLSLSRLFKASQIVTDIRASARDLSNEVKYYELTIRKDDAPETVKARLDTFHRETEPLKAFYAARGKLVCVDNQPSIEETTAAIRSALEI